MDRDFKGVWIPKEVWLDERLNALDKIILAEIDSLDNTDVGCFASNEHIANFCQCSERKVSEAISKLIKLEYLYVESFNGRTRILRSRLSNYSRQPSKICEAESQKMLPSNINSNNNIDNNLKEKYKKEKLLSILDYWNSKNIIVHKSSNDILETINSALKKETKENIMLAIDHYKEILDSAYFFSYKWSLVDFLKRKTGYKSFLNDGSNWVNYLEWKNNPKPQYNNSKTVEKKELSDFEKNWFKEQDEKFWGKK